MNILQYSYSMNGILLDQRSYDTTPFHCPETHRQGHRASITIYARPMRRTWTRPGVTWVDDLGLISRLWESHSTMKAITKTKTKPTAYMPVRAPVQPEKSIPVSFPQNMDLVMLRLDIIHRPFDNFFFFNFYVTIH